MYKFMQYTSNNTTLLNPYINLKLGNCDNNVLNTVLINEWNNLVINFVGVLFFQLIFVLKKKKTSSAFFKLLFEYFIYEYFWNKMDHL